MGLKTKIKTRLMLGSMKKQKKAGFPVEEAEHYKLRSDCDKNFNNSYYLTAHGDNISLYLRLGIRGDGTTEVWTSVKATDDYVVNAKTLYTDGDVPLKVSCVKTAEKWEHTYCGEAFTVEFDGVEAMAGSKRRALKLKLDFTSKAPLYDFFTHGNDLLAARTYARSKWNDEFFEGLKKNKQTHYEQYGFVSGEIEIDGKKYSLDGVPAVRDHSYGMRDWGYMNRHFWVVGTASDGKAFNISMVSYPNARGIHAGNYYSDGKIVNIADFSIKGDTVCGGKGPVNLTVKFKLVDGRIMELTGKRKSETVYSLQGGAYELIEGYGEYVLNGETYRGIWEFGYNANEEKWKAYEDLSSI